MAAELAKQYNQAWEKCHLNFREKAEVYDRPGETWADKFPHGLTDISFMCWQKTRRLLAALEKQAADGEYVIDSAEAKRAVEDSLVDLVNYAIFGLCILDADKA